MYEVTMKGKHVVRSEGYDVSSWWWECTCGDISAKSSSRNFMFQQAKDHAQLHEKEEAVAEALYRAMSPIGAEWGYLCRTNPDTAKRYRAGARAALEAAQS